MSERVARESHAATFSKEEGDDSWSIGGRLDADSVPAIWTGGHDALRQAKGPIAIDAAKLEYCDGAGVALLCSLRTAAEAEKKAFEIRNLADPIQILLRQFPAESIDLAKTKPHTRPLGWVETIGKGAFTFGADFVQQVEFAGQLAVGAVRTIRQPSSIRWGDAVVVFEKTGVQALPIVGMISFLMGFIMAFQSAIPLKTFGVDLFVVNLVSLAILRELGPLMTAIMLAGRSGSAFAAEIGTMKVNEEINALDTMGIDPTRFLAMPRIAATVVATPLLTIYADLVGIAGGFAVMMLMGFPAVTLWNQMVSAVALGDVMSGLIKSVAFGFLVASIGCLRGLQTRAGAAAVGDSTTRSVVSGIFLIILTDAVFSVVFYFLKI